jgi:hypothetical protein
LVLIVIFIAVCEYNADELVSFTGTCITPVWNLQTSRILRMPVVRSKQACCILIFKELTSAKFMTVVWYLYWCLLWFAVLGLLWCCIKSLTFWSYHTTAMWKVVCGGYWKYNSSVKHILDITLLKNLYRKEYRIRYWCLLLALGWNLREKCQYFTVHRYYRHLLVRQPCQVIAR